MIHDATLLIPSALPVLATLLGRIAPLDGKAVLRLVSGSIWLTGLCYGGMAALLIAAGSGWDPISVVLSALTLFIAVIVFEFSCRHMRADRNLAGYAERTGLLVSSALVMINAQDFLLFMAGWAASGWLLADAIGHNRNWVQAQDAKAKARRAFLISDACLAAGLGGLAIGWGASSFSELREAAPDGPWLVAPLLLILVAALARCAAPPFHKWLMGSMTAPTPVSALMHAGLVNAGGLLLLRVSPALDTSEAVKIAAVVAGAFGALFGTGVMVVRPDAKRSLGGSTVAQMSFMIMTCGLGAYAAALWHLIAHGLFKAWAFLGAGSNIGRVRPAMLASWTPSLATLTAGLAIAITVAAAGAWALPLPLLLAVVAGVAGCANIARAQGQASLAIIAASAGLTVSYVVGLAAIEALPGLGKGAPPLNPALQLVLLAAFLTAWIWQSARLPVPAPLYVRMLNTGGPALVR